MFINYSYAALSYKFSSNARGSRLKKHLSVFITPCLYNLLSFQYHSLLSSFSFLVINHLGHRPLGSSLSSFALDHFGQPVDTLSDTGAIDSV